MNVTEAIERKIREIPNQANRKIVEAYVVEAREGAKPQSVLSRMDAIVALGKHLGAQPWTAAQRSDVVAAIGQYQFSKGSHRTQKPLPKKSLAPTTKYQWATHLKMFYKWLFGTDETPALVRRLPFKKDTATGSRIREMALAPSEVGQLVGGAQSVRDRCIILLLIETGFRASEAAALRLDHMQKRQHGYWFTLPPEEPLLKTKAREVAVPVISSAPELEAWLAIHPRIHESRAPLFVSLSSRSYGKRLNGKTIGEVVTRASRRAGMRHVHAHMLRHTSATLKVARGMEPELIRLWHGWSKTSTMPGYYSHVRPHFERMALEAHGLRHSEPALADIMGGQRCGLCGERNRVTDRQCRACGSMLAAAHTESEKAFRVESALQQVESRAVSALEDLLFDAVAELFGLNDMTGVDS